MKTNNINIKKKESIRRSAIFKLSHFQIGTLILIITALTLTSCNHGNDQTAMAKPNKSPLVKVQPVMKTKMVSFIEITGTIQANVFTDIV